MTMVDHAPAETIVDQRPQCWRCGKVFAVFLGRPWHIDCPRCHAPNKREGIAQEVHSK